MTIDHLKAQIPDYAKDLRLNISSILRPDGAPGLSVAQHAMTALACAYSVANSDLIKTIEAELADALTDESREAAKTASALMAMNNVYYRFTHLVGNDEYSKLPAKLRMNALARPTVDKLDFEIMSLAVSAINGGGMCMSSHEKIIRKGGVGAEGVQSAARIGAVIAAVANVLRSEAAAAA